MFTLKGVDFMFRNDHDTYDRYSSYDSYGQEARIAGSGILLRPTVLWPAPWL